MGRSTVGPSSSFAESHILIFELNSLFGVLLQAFYCVFLNLKKVVESIIVSSAIALWCCLVPVLYAVLKRSSGRLAWMGSLFLVGGSAF
jgi:hypothetical protein